MPGVLAKADRREAAAFWLPMTTTGWPAPAGKWAASTVSPMTESGCPRKDCALVRPLAFRPVSPSASTPRTTAVVTQTSRGRGAMAQPTRAHSPRSVGSGEP
jgi:hypothetical protein